MNPEKSLEVCRPRPETSEEPARNASRSEAGGPEKEVESEVHSVFEVNGLQVLVRELPEVKDREKQTELVEKIKNAGDDWRQIFSLLTELYCLQEMPDHAKEMKGAETLIALYEAYKEKEKQEARGEEVSLETLTEIKGLNEQLKQPALNMREATLRLIIQITGIEIKPETEEMVRKEKGKDEEERTMREEELDDGIEEEVPQETYQKAASKEISTPEAIETAKQTIEATKELLNEVSLFYRNNKDLQSLLYTFAKEPKHIGRPKTGENYLVLWVGFNSNLPQDAFVIKNQLIIQHLLKERYWHLQFQEQVDLTNLPEEVEEERLAA